MDMQATLNQHFWQRYKLRPACAQRMAGAGACAASALPFPLMAMEWGWGVSKCRAVPSSSYPLGELKSENMCSCDGQWCIVVAWALGVIGNSKNSGLKNVKNACLKKSFVMIGSVLPACHHHITFSLKKFHGCIFASF